LFTVGISRSGTASVDQSPSSVNMQGSPMPNAQSIIEEEA